MDNLLAEEQASFGVIKSCTHIIYVVYIHTHISIGPIDEEPVESETDEEDVYWDDGDTLSESEDDNEEF